MSVGSPTKNKINYYYYYYYYLFVRNARGVTDHSSSRPALENTNNLVQSAPALNPVTPLVVTTILFPFMLTRLFVRNARGVTDHSSSRPALENTNNLVQSAPALNPVTPLVVTTILFPFMLTRLFVRNARGVTDHSSSRPALENTNNLVQSAPALNPVTPLVVTTILFPFMLTRLFVRNARGVTDHSSSRPALENTNNLVQSAPALNPVTPLVVTTM